MLMSPDFSVAYTQEIRGKILAASDHLEVKNCTKIYLRQRSHRPPSWWGGARNPLPPKPQPALAHHLPSPGKKILRTAMFAEHLLL